jgi:phage terminase small subunit
MPTLRNPKWEKFAQLVASGLTAQAAFTQAGYPSPQNAPRLRNNPLVAKRIEELQARNERKAEAIALSRDELIEVLTDIVHAARSRLSEARLGDGLKAAEMLAKICGWNEPEQVKHDHVHLQVDSALIEQLRAGYAQLSERRAKELLPLPSEDGIGGAAPAGGYASQEEPA